MTAFGKSLQAIPTPIPGLTVWELPVHGDDRGWFKENWQRAKMTSAGLPDFGPVQNNVSFNDAVGTTRGIHAEPWDKFISVAAGRVFGAWVDLREGATFGTVFTAEIDPSRAVFVPRGVGNAYQTLDPDTSYTYLVNDHWSAEAAYSFLNLADETVAVPWPISLDRAEVSAKDLTHPRLGDVRPVPPKKLLVIGSDGQLGRALRARLGDGDRVEYADRDALDIGDASVLEARHWRDYAAIINAAAYTAVDAAETSDGRRDAWRANVAGVTHLAQIASLHGITLVHVSTDYVFDGTSDAPYGESEAVSPLGVYGQTKAAADALVSTVPRHYIVRTSWVIGEGHNFVRTMASLADRGIDPSVVDDQHGRLTFSTDLATAILHLLAHSPEPGIYNVTGDGEPMTWADVAARVYELLGHDPARITRVSTAEYDAGSAVAPAPRPRNSVLSLEKARSVDVPLADAAERLAEYVARLSE